MNEQEQYEPLSFKGQMAARYRERLSMGFTLANDNKGEANDTSAGPAVAATLSDPPGALIRHGIFRAADQTMDASEVAPGTSHNLTATVALPMAPRSKSSLEDNQTIVPKPTMKDLITKFETRFITSTQLRQNTEEDDEKHRIARDAWGSSCPRIKLELDPSAMTSSSSSDVIDSKSSQTLSKPPQAKTSRATLSLNYDTNSRLQMLQCLNRPRSRQSGGNATEQLGIEDNLNLTNSHRFTDSQNINTDNQLEADNVEEVPVTKEDTMHNPCVASNLESLPDKPERAEKELKQTSDEPEASAVRVNLRDFAQRKKNATENKYIVHTKDWGKRLSKKDTANSPLDVAAFESISHNISTLLENEKDSSLKDNKSRNVLDVYKSGVNKIKQNISSPHLPFSNQKADVRSRSRQSDRSDESKDVPKDEKQHTKAMERYLQFLRSSNPPPVSQVTNDAKTEKTDLRRALRPPTPHRTNQLHKGSVSAFRNIAYPLREANQSTGGMPEMPRLPSKNERGVRLEHLFLHRPRSRQSLTTENKEISIDPSGGDFFVTPTFSSTNSVDSNVCEANNKLNTGDSIAQPKTETSDIRLHGQVPVTKPASKWSTLPGRNSAVKKLAKNTHVRPQSARAHDTSDQKQIKQVTSFLRTRSSSTSKTMVPTLSAKKASSLFSSPKSVISVASSNPFNATHRISPTVKRKPQRELKLLKYEASDTGSLLLTEDELADNDLVPVHLRERKPRDLSGQLTLAMSSSDDSQNARPVSKLGTQFKKLSEASSEKRMPSVPEIIDRMEPQCFDDEARPVNKTVFSSDDSKCSKNHPQESKQSEDNNNKFFVLHGKRRSTVTATKCLDYPKDDLTRHRTTSMHHWKLPNAHMASPAAGNKTGDLSNIQTIKETKDTKEGSNLTSSVVPDERKAGYVTRDGRDRKVFEQYHRRTPEPLNTCARGDNLHAAGESSVDKAFTGMMVKPAEPGKGSPTRRTTLQKATGNTSSFTREHAKERRGDASVEPNMLQTELVSRSRESSHRMTDNMYNPFHFGHTHEKDEAYFEADTKLDKTPAASPQKKKRKSDHPKKPAKKKKKLEAAVDDTCLQIRSPLSMDLFVTKTHKSKSRDTSRKDEDPVDKMDRGDKSEICEQPVKKRSSGELSVKSHKMSKHRKDSSQTW
ncbi:unnamed protein product, partial [Candidula unifasciata]